MIKKKLDHLHMLVGRLSSRVSEVELGWYMIFTCIMHQCPRSLVDAIINTQRNSDGQRNFVLATAREIWPDTADGKRQPEYDFICILKNRTEELVGRRNSAIHAIIEIGDFLVPHRIVVVGTTKRSKLADISDIETELSTAYDSAKEIVDAIWSFLEALDTCGQRSPDSIPPQLRAGWKHQI